jgi:hypothetical protein
MLIAILCSRGWADTSDLSGPYIGQDRACMGSLLAVVVLVMMCFGIMGRDNTIFFATRFTSWATHIQINTGYVSILS